MVEIGAAAYIALIGDGYTARSPFDVFTGVLSGAAVTITIYAVITVYQKHVSSPEYKMRRSYKIVLSKYVILNSELRRKRNELEKTLRISYQSPDKNPSEKAEQIEHELENLNKKVTQNTYEIYYELEKFIDKYSNLPE